MIKNKKCEKVNHSLITKYKVFTNKKHEWEREREIERAVAVERERERAVSELIRTSILHEFHLESLNVFIDTFLQEWYLII